MDLIPGLPNDVALECLIRVPFHHFPTAASVCKGWKVEIELPEFRQLRKAVGLSRSVFVMSQARVDPNRKHRGGVKLSATPIYRLTLCDPETGDWWDLPTMPGFSDGLLMFCQLVGVGSDLVVMGGCDPVTWETSNSVFIYNFVSAKWRRGSDMPGAKRSFFACASDFDRTVFVAGGHDDEKNALRSAMTYDVADDKWVFMPDMTRERDECKGLFHSGKFHVIGGYCTEMQGLFKRSAEAFDVARWRWGQVQEGFFDSAMCPRTCVDGGDGSIYICREGNLLTTKGTAWQVITRLPVEVSNTTYVSTWQGKLLTIGCANFGEPHIAYVMDPKKQMWAKVEAPEEFTGHVLSGCFLEI